MADDAQSLASTSRPGSPVGSLPGVFPNTRQPAFRFNWDPSQRRRQGPGSVLSDNESRMDFGGVSVTPRNDIFNLSSATLSSGALPNDWSSVRHGFHAISTVLNNPRKRQAPPAAHSRLPAVPPADLPRIRRKDFEGYLRDIAPEWERFERARLSLDQPENSSATQLQTPTISPPLQLFRSTSAYPIPSLDIVPPIFFDAGFNLGNPATFVLVTEQSSATDSSSGQDIDPASISHSLPLLEKLSHYADIVEQHLVREVQARSSSFFEALGNLHDLQSESERCLKRIGELKGMLKDVDDKQAKRGLEIVRSEFQIEEMIKVEEGVKVLKDVNDMKGTAQGLVAAGEWRDALNVIENIQHLWDHTSTEMLTARPPPTIHATSLAAVAESPLPSPARTPSEAPPPTPLASLHAFSSLPQDLRALTSQISSFLSSELVAVLRIDMGSRIEMGDSRMAEDDLTFRDQIRPLLLGLLRTNGVRGAIVGWRDVAMADVRASVKRHLPLSVTEPEDEEGVDQSLTAKSASLAQNLKTMEHESFMLLLRHTLGSLLRCLHGVEVQSQAILDTLDSIVTNSKDPSLPRLSRSPLSYDSETLKSDLSDILSSATELGNSRVSKIASVRAEQHAQLKLREFYQYFEESWAFVVACEVLCRRMIVGFRGSLVSQSKAFLQAFHGKRLQDSAKLVEDEQWGQIEVSQRSQRIVDVVIDCAVNDALEVVFAKPSPVNGVTNGASPTPSMETPPPTASVPNGEGAGIAATGNAKYLKVEERTYYVVSATMQVLQLVIDYLKVLVNLPLMNMECMSRLVEFLKAFNSRTCQVVLGAGAMRSAGLKNITARHLALASQSLSVMISLIPYIRETFRRHLNPKQAVMLVEFDKLKRDYQEHQNEIHSKLIAIMGERLSVHCKSLQEIRWDILPSQRGPSTYAEQLVKETVTLHKVLSKYLGSGTTEPIMSEVFASINHRLAEEYQRIDLPSLEAKERLLTDARFVHEKLSALRGASALSNMLETIVQEKGVRTKSVLYPNGVANGGIAKSGTGSAPVTIGNDPPTPGNRTPTTPARTSTPLGANSNPSNLANRPSPFAKRGLTGLGLLGGVVSVSNLSLGSTRSESPAESDAPGEGAPTTETGSVGEEPTQTPMSESAPFTSLSGAGLHVEGSAESATISMDNGGLGPTSGA